jgi:disulfide bond formation protein DsbB
MAFNRTGRGASAPVFTGIFMACLGLLGYALVLQHLDGLDPCPWCVVQRLGFIGIAMVSLVAALHRPGAAGTVVYSFFAGLVAAAGAAAAGYHIWIQSSPERAMSCAGSPVERFLDASKIGKMIPPLLQYDGLCTIKPWKFLTLSIPEWSLVWFVILLVTLIATPFLFRK